MVLVLVKGGGGTASSRVARVLGFRRACGLTNTPAGISLSLFLSLNIFLSLSLYLCPALFLSSLSHTLIFLQKILKYTAAAVVAVAATHREKHILSLNERKREREPRNLIRVRCSCRALGRSL